MFRMNLTSLLISGVLVALPLAASADSDHDHDERSHSHESSAGAPSDLAGAWSALQSARDAIAADVESGALGEVHSKAEPLPERVADLIAQSGDLDAAKRARVEGAAKQVARVADALHDAADAGNAEQTRKELTRLDRLLELIRAQYPAGAFPKESSEHHHDHSQVSGHEHGAHAHSHAQPPAGIVNLPPSATVHVRAVDTLRFEPTEIAVQAGVPTRIELENLGAVEHSLVVKTPDGDRDWVHLHAAGGVTAAATYQLNEPGRYQILCTIPGHREAGMIGELVVGKAASARRVSSAVASASRAPLAGLPRARGYTGGAR